MKSILLFFFSLHSLLAVAQEQRISLHQKNSSLKQVFLEIEEQTGYSIAYNNTTLDVEKSLSVDISNRTLEEVISTLLIGTGHEYTIIGTHVVISRTKKGTGIKEGTVVQTVRGKVMDAGTGQPVFLANVVLSDSQGTLTDSAGVFRLQNVPVGRYDLQVSCLGYQAVIIPELLVTSSKEVSLSISIREKPTELKEVIILPEINKGEPLNKMAIAGGRMMRMEEVNRFANGFDDPARLAAVFPGVAGSIGTNAVAVRGNSPLATQWRIEGVEVLNPNHFSDLIGLGGGFLSGLSTHAMANSDFYNGTLPAEYTNVSSGVFDMFIRNGNNQRYEHAFQLGLLGIDLASEGPLGKKNGSSYLFNYRFSTTSLASRDDLDMRYQDLTFKFHIPTKKAGEFAVWGIGLKDGHRYEPLEQWEWESLSDRRYQDIRQEKMITGVNHLYRFNRKTMLRSSVGMNYQKDNVSAELLDEQLNLIPYVQLENRQWQLNVGSSVERRFSDKHINKTGFILNGLKYDLDYKVSPHTGLNEPARQVAKGEGESMVVSLYSQSLIHFNEQWSSTIGVASQLFTLNNHWTLEPRLALKWNFHPGHSVAALYGLHARREKLDYYFLDMPDIQGNNKKLDFSKANHWGISYAWTVSEGLHFKAEPYFQYLYDVPVEEGTSFSVINGEDFYMDRLLINAGKGRNYGIDLSLERYLKNGYYYMFTASLFKSAYRGGDKIWRSTRHDKRFILNAITGKEWMVGRNKQNMFNLNLRFSVQGGDRYTPVDEEKSHSVKWIELDETCAFSEKFKPALIGDISLNYRINKKRVSHEFSIKVLNIGAYTGSHGYIYNERYNIIQKEKGYGLIPNISYKLYF